MSELKPLSRDAIPRALEKALRYRVLNEPGEAESICRDILVVEPEHQEALVTLLLCLTDLFPRQVSGTVEEAWQIVSRIDGEYEKAYYSGIICERKAKDLLRRNAPGCGPVVYEGLKQAMDWFVKAEKIRPAGNDDALLRWNTCVRLMSRHPEVRPAEDDRSHPPLMLE